MTRGNPATEGATRISQNGYHYTKTKKGWRLTHHIIAEEKLGRPLTVAERVKFIDGNRRNLKPSNIQVIRKGTSSQRARLAVIEARIEELEAERDQLQLQLELREENV